MKLIILQLQSSKQLLCQADIFDLLPDPAFPEKIMLSARCIGVMVQVRNSQHIHNPLCR